MMKAQRFILKLLSVVTAVWMIPAVVCFASDKAGGEKSGPAVTVWTIHPDPVKGKMTRFSLGSDVVLTGTSSEVAIPFDQVIRVESESDRLRVIRKTASTLRLQGGSLLFELVDGDWVVAKPLGCSEDRCRLGLGDGAELTTSPGAIDSLRSRNATLPSRSDAVESLLAVRSRDEDRVLLTNGDVLHGFIGRVDANGLTVENGGGEVVVPYSVVVAAKFASEPTPLPGRPFVRIHLLTGARLTCPTFDISEGEVTASYIDGEIVSLKPEAIGRIDVIGGRWQGLSSLRPLTYEHTPMLGLAWEFRRNRNVVGGPLVVAGRSFETGLGVHSRSRLSFELKGQFHEFVTRFGLDDSAGPLADVDVSVLVDGIARFSRKGVRAGVLSDAVRLEVERANRIELVVDFGENGDIQDRFDWIEPGLIR